MDKQQALLQGALRVFARDGYSRASIQVLAAEARVSTRTIYNQYGNKEALFRAVIIDSATRVADRQIELLEEIFRDTSAVRATLLQFGKTWTAPDPATESHFAMLRQVQADTEHINPDTLEAWRYAGPQRVRLAIAAHLQTLSDKGLLSIPSPEIAATHLVQLTAGTLGALGPTAETEEIISAGVDVFLAAYQPNSTPHKNAPAP